MKLKKLLALLLTVVLLVASSVAVFPVNAAEGDADASVWDGTLPSRDLNTAYAGGDGSEANPYQIETAAQLALFAINVNNANGAYASKYFQLTADIDLNNCAWTPIGSSASNSKYHFTGHFDGNGHVIKNLYVNSTAQSQGLFGTIGSNATVSNLGIVNANVATADQSNATYIGTLVGYINNGAEITNCYCSGKVAVSISNQYGYVGGLIGFSSSSTLTNCYSVSDVSVTGSASTTICYVGGLIGHSSSTLTLTNCYSLGDVAVSTSYEPTANNGNVPLRVGGLLGSNGAATVTLNNCFYNGSVGLNGSNNAALWQGTVGGIVGMTTGVYTLKLESVTAIADITLDKVNSGSRGAILIGTTENASSTVTLSACYAKGTIAATNVTDFYRRGVIGYNYQTPINRTGSGTEEDPYAWTSNGSLWNITSCTKNGNTLSAVVVGQDNGGVNTVGNLGFASGTKNVDVSALNLLSGVGAQQRTVNDTFAVRFVGELLVKDYSNFASVGVLVSITYGESKITDHKLSSTSLYVSLNAEGGDITPEKGYLIAGGIYDVPNGANDEVTFTFKPYVELADGTVCYGETSATYTATAGALAVAQ
ncbi:MAG: hypothetical protein IJW55_06290 [Clostridia bacterium]|nr:hypothetical protein [Clostridia bacterium]